MNKLLLRSVSALVFLAATTASAQVRLVNMVPNSRSGETNQDAEPTITVDPLDFNRMAGSAFTWDNLDASPMVTATAPIFVSTDRGNTWVLAFIVPSKVGATFPTGDINIAFGGTLSGAPTHTTSWLYGGTLSSATAGRPMTVLRAQDPFDPAVMTTLDTRSGNVDQPHAAARTAATGEDKLYIGFNSGFSCIAPSRRSATVDLSQDAKITAPTLSTTVIESRNNACQNGFAQVPAAHLDGTVYAAFIHDWCGSCNTPRMVVVRDDNWGIGATPFQALTDPSDNLPGRFIAPAMTLASGVMGQNRLGASNVSIAVDPRTSDRVYVAWGDSGGANSETIHVRRSTNRGVDWSPSDILTATNAMNPQIAINDLGTVGVLYQQVVSGRWETHFVRTTDADATTFDTPGLSLATQDATTPAATFSPYIGDYASLVSAGHNFVGMFSASNFPDKANFVASVQYQREVDWVNHKLFTDASHTTEVAPSIDPFFFEVSIPVPQIQVPGDITFDRTCIGAKSTKTLNVCNTGKDDLIVNAITSSSPSVTVTTPSSSYPVTISHDFCFPFQAKFDAAAAGSQTATLTIPSNDPTTPNTSVAVSASGSEPDIRITGSPNFGTVSAWGPGEKTLKVCNTGGCDLAVTSATLGCTDFALVNNPFPAIVSHDFCLDLVAKFTPTRLGLRTCNLSVASNDPDTPVVNQTLTAHTPPFWSLHAGLVAPHGALSSTVRHGPTFNLDYVYPWRPRWAWDVRFGISTFEGQPGQSDTKLSTLSANVRYTQNPGAPAQVFFNAGLGMYHFDPGSVEGGINLGVGLNIPLNPRFALEATYNYHTTLTTSPTLRFSQFQLGLLVSF